MKTRVLLFSLILIGTTINGQTIYVKMGPSFSKLIWNNSIVYDQVFDKSIIGVDAIAGINYLNFKYFNLSSGAGYIQKGGSKATMGCVSTTANEHAAIRGLSVMRVVVANKMERKSKHKLC